MTANFLGERDLWVYDEEPENIKLTSMARSDFLKVVEWTRAIGKHVDEAEDAFAWASIAADNITHNYLAVERQDWMQTIADWPMLDFLSEHPAPKIEVNDINQFCKAAIGGKAFVNRKTWGDREEISFNGLICELPYPEKTVILSASAWVSGYRFATELYMNPMDSHLPLPDYGNLKLVHLEPPTGLPKYYKGYWKSQKARTKIQEQLEELIEIIPENRVYLTAPKPVAELIDEVCYFEKPTHISHHGVGTGSNEFRDCDAVVYYLDNHIPGKAHVSRTHAVMQTEVTDEALADAQHKLGGIYKDFKLGQYRGNMMQQIGRGTIRDRKPMTAYMVVNRDLFDTLPSLFPGCQVEYWSKEGKAKRIINRVADALRDDPSEEVTITELEMAFGFDKLRRYADLFEQDKLGVLDSVGRQFVRGTRGRYAKPGRFVLKS